MPIGKVFAALARKRPLESLRSQGEAGWGVLAEATRGNAAMKFAARLLRACALRCAAEVRCMGRLLLALLGGGMLSWMPCDVR